MAEFDKIRFFLFVSLMIFPAHALDVILSSAQENFKQKSEIKTIVEDGKKIYDGTADQLTYRVRPTTSKVIVYICGRSRFVEIVRNAVHATRLRIVWELNEWHYELVFLGIENFDDDEYHLISAFMGDKIRCHPYQESFSIETIGEDHFDQFYRNSSKYQENAHVCGGNLRARLRSFHHGALRSVGKNDKEIRLYDYLPFANEVTWSVTVENDTYIPNVDATDPRYNFKLRYPNMDIYLVIFSGKEYLKATAYSARSPEMRRIKKTLSTMSVINNEVLIILGAFNFDWTEVDIVTQVILKHSEVSSNSVYNVYTCGFGMFNTIYLNMKTDGRFLLQKPNSNVAEILVLLLAENVKDRSMDVYYSDDGFEDLTHLKFSITLFNGRYLRAGRLDNFSFSWSNEKIAFIVYESTEMNSPMDYSKVWQPVKNLKPSGINVVVIETANFEWYDAHIIAEWIDLHKGNVNAEQIAVLGGGIFDTLFQSPTTTYNTFFHIKKTDLEGIRNTFVKNGNGKRVFAAKMDRFSHFNVWTYPMNTVNGFYEPDLIPDANMFDSGNVKKIFFIITSAHNFHRISAENWESVASTFRRDIEDYYPTWQWSVVLVGLDNFEERDYHLFAELVKMQIKDRRSWKNFVCTFNYGISQAMHQYNDNAPLARETRPQICALITTFFGKILMADDA